MHDHLPRTPPIQHARNNRRTCSLRRRKNLAISPFPDPYFYLILGDDFDEFGVGLLRELGVGFETRAPEFEI